MTKLTADYNEVKKKINELKDRTEEIICYINSKVWEI